VRRLRAQSGYLDRVKLNPASESTDFSFDFQDPLRKPERR